MFADNKLVTDSNTGESESGFSVECQRRRRPSPFEKLLVVVVVCAVLAGRGEPGAATINSLREERHSSARGAPSDRRQNR